jgi:hypothetical protein
MRYEGEILFNKELTASEILAIQNILTLPLDPSQPNKGLIPFLLVDFKTLQWDETEAFEMEAVLVRLISKLPSGIVLSGVLTVHDSEFPENSHKIHIKNNKIKLYGIDDKILEEKLLICPHCQKIFKAEAFREVTESEFIRDV